MSDPPKFRCAAAVYSHNACQGEPFYSEHGGERFCILHCPTDDKGEAFDEAVARKLDHDDWNFNSVWFPNPIDWRDRTVQKDVNFSSARFRETVDFSKTKFEGECHFDGARFSARAEFVRSRFSGGVYFNGARFAHDASFADAEFASDAGLYEVTAPDISFRGATFKEAPSALSEIQLSNDLSSLMPSSQAELSSRERPRYSASRETRFVERDYCHT